MNNDQRMGLVDKSSYEQFVPLFGFVLMLFLMGFLDWLFLQVGVDSKKIMRKPLFALTPQSPAFGIWGLIFGGLGLFTFLNCLNEFAGTIDALWISVTFLLGTAWFTAFSFEFFSLSALCLIGSVVSAFQVILDIPETHDFMHLGTGYTMGIYLGWLISASLLNIFIFIQQRVVNGQENSFVNYLFLILLFVSHIAVVFLLQIETLTMCWPITLTLLWSVHWVLWKKEDMVERDESWEYLTAYSFASVLVLTSILRVWLQFDFFKIDVDLHI